MASKVSICSNALLLLGDKTVNVLNDGSDRAVLVANLYDSCRDDLLRSHPWNFAIKRVILAPDVDAPEFDYSAQFTLPGDVLRIIQVGEERYPVDYKVEGGKILHNGTALPLKYVFRNDAEAKWGANFVKAMELKMAADLAYPITASASLAQVRQELFDRHMKFIRSVDGQEEPAQTLGDSPLLASRFGGFNYPGPR